MVIDVNAYIGHYPFRMLKYKTAEDLIGLMDYYGVDMCCVASLTAVYFKDCMEGNRALFEAIKPFTGRLVPFCVINPEYNDAANDFRQCVEQFGCRGLRLFPRQQGYKLDGAQSAELLRMAGKMKIPVHIPILLEDLRGHHPLDIAEPIDAGEIKRAALLAPETDFILSNDYLNGFAKTIEPAVAGRPGKFYYDIGRVDCLCQTMMEELVAIAGYERVVFGSGAMLQNISVQFVKLHYMGATMGTTPEQLKMITHKNLAGLLSKR